MQLVTWISRTSRFCVALSVYMIVQQHVVHTKTTQGSGVVRALLSARAARAVQRSDAIKLQSTNSAILEFPSDVPYAWNCYM